MKFTMMRKQFLLIIEWRDDTGGNRSCMCRNLDFSSPWCYSSKWDTASLHCTLVLFFCGWTARVRIVGLEIFISLPSQARVFYAVSLTGLWSVFVKPKNCYFVSMHIESSLVIFLKARKILIIRCFSPGVDNDSQRHR